MLAVRMVFSINRLRKSLCVTWNGKEGRSRKTKNTGEKNLRFRERATVRVGLKQPPLTRKSANCPPPPHGTLFLLGWV